MTDPMIASNRAIGDLMKADNIQVLVMAERPVIRNDAKSELDVVVEIRTRPTSASEPLKSALNLCAVLDRSGSMQEEKLETAKRPLLHPEKTALRDGSFLTVTRISLSHAQMSFRLWPAASSSLISGQAWRPTRLSSVACHTDVRGAGCNPVVRLKSFPCRLTLYATKRVGCDRLRQKFFGK